MSKTILVTGGAGYIGSHTLVELLTQGYDTVVVDDLSNSDEKALDRVQQITGKKTLFYRGNIMDRELMERVLTENKIDACIHFAAFKAVAESIEKPLDYYWNNIAGTVGLLKMLFSHGCKNFIFSSSATVYGAPEKMPVDETFPKGSCTNPYGWTKHMNEQILSDVWNSDKSANIILLRYFNPIGAHESGLIGENPKGIPNNLMPYITQVAVGKREMLGVFGNDYDTPDGTCIRDYIHVCDLASGHVAALKKLFDNCGLQIYNLGTGTGYSVLDVIHNFEKASGVKIPFVFKPRRPGDVAVTYSSAKKAEEELGWKAKYDILRMCEDSWRWQKQNPNGYDD